MLSTLEIQDVPYVNIQANKLTTVKKCLNEVLKYGGAFSPRELYPVSFNLDFLAPTDTAQLVQYQLALHQIDSMRRDGKFVGVDGNIPEGQGIVMAHLNECHQLLEMVSTSNPPGNTDIDVGIS